VAGDEDWETVGEVVAGLAVVELGSDASDEL
jgi:hypothetical protein